MHALYIYYIYIYIHSIMNTIYGYLFAWGNTSIGDSLSARFSVAWQFCGWLKLTRTVMARIHQVTSTTAVIN